jgi:hypothetical protein
MREILIKPYQYRFTVIIPLEFHRGQIENCLRGWVSRQTFDRNKYEILAAGCTTSLGTDAVSQIKNLLRSHDRLLLSEQPHDMALFTSASPQARGEILVFTESHCLPDPNLLSIANEKLDTHPEWAGFSGSAARLTHNVLSVAEADMYQDDIEYGLTSHPWRKILDQIFVVRNENYINAGGFIGDLGHFAEWHLAARMHEKKYQIEYVPEVQVTHYYTGDDRELIEFTRDFTRGEMKYKAEFIDDPCQAYFPESNEWSIRFKWLPRLANKALVLARHAHARACPSFFFSSIEFFMHMYLLLTWHLRAFTGIRPRLFLAILRFRIALTTLQIGNFFNFRKNILRTLLLRLIEKCIRLERIKFVQEWLGTPQDENLPLQKTDFEWQPDVVSENIHVLGFHPMEEWKESKFRWSEPVAMVEFSLQPGKYRFTMNWLPIRLIKNLVVYLDENPLPISRTESQAAGIFDISSSQPARFSWTCESFIHYKFDRRMLGVPLKSIIWTRIDHDEA